MAEDTPRIHEMVYTLDTIDSVANEVLTCMARARVLTFRGDLGAGKTTLIQAILRQSGIESPAPSPTYAYLNTYTNARGETFYHFDLYRLSSLDAFYEAGFHEYLYVPNAWALIESPEVIQNLVSQDVCHFTLYHYGYERRKVQYTCQ